MCVCVCDVLHLVQIYFPYINDPFFNKGDGGGDGGDDSGSEYVIQI